MKSKNEILQEMILDAVAENDSMTYYGKDGVTRAILNSAANVFIEAWNDHYQTKRDLQITTAEGQALIELGSKIGINEKLGPSKSSCIVLINGPSGTVINEGTLIKSNFNPSAQYETMNEIILGNKNPNILRPLYLYSLGDIVLVESIETGSKTRVAPKELTSFVTNIPNVSVTNLIPSVGGNDEESDTELRERILGQYSLLNQGTVAFYKALAREANETVFRVLPKYNPRNGGIDIFLVKNSLGNFLENELTDIGDYIYAKQRALNKITCYNCSFRSIEIECFVRTRPGSDFDDTYRQVAEKIAGYVDVGSMNFGQKVRYYEILDLITDIDNIIDIDSSRLLLNGGRMDVQCLWNEIPRFAYLSVKNQAIDKAENIQQSYLII